MLYDASSWVEKTKKFEQRVKKMSISYGRSSKNSNNDCLQKIMGTTVYMGFHLLVAFTCVREPSWETKIAPREPQRAMFGSLGAVLGLSTAQDRPKIAPR